MTSRPAAPESLVKRLCAWVDADGADPLHLEAAAEIERLERRLSLAQTEIKGHMRVAKEATERAEKSDRRCKVMSACYDADLAEAQVRIAELEKDAARLDYLEREMELEQKYLRDFSREDRSLALFRRNVPITRSAIDAALKSRA